MDRAEGKRRKLREVPSIDNSTEDEKVEPWAWRGKEIPPEMAERLAQYQEFLEEWANRRHRGEITDSYTEARNGD